MPGPKLMVLLLLGGCGTPAPVEAPRPTPSPPPAAAPSAAVPAASPPGSAPRQTYHRDDFRDPDALPPGALRRFGSRRLHGTRELALLDNGWLVEGGRLWRVDGHVVDWTNGRFLGRRGDDLAFFDADAIHWVHPDGRSIGDAKLDCDGGFPWLSMDGKHVFCGGRAPEPDGGGRTRVFEARTGKTRSELPFEVWNPSRTQTVAGDRWVSEQIRDGNRELVAYDLGTAARLWRRPSFDTHALSLSPDAKTLYRIDGQGHLLAHDPETGERRWRFALPPWRLQAPLRVSSDGRRLAFMMRRLQADEASRDRVGWLDLTTRRVAILAEGVATQIDFSSRGTEVALEIDRELRVIDLGSGGLLLGPAEPYRAYQDARVYGDLLVAVSRRGELKTWDRATGAPRLTQQLPGDVREVHALPPPYLGVTTGWPRTYRVIDVTTGKQRCTLPAEQVGHVLRWPGGEVAFVEDSIRSTDGRVTSRLTAVGLDCRVIAQHEVEGQIIEAELTPRHHVEVVVGNGGPEDESTHLWRVNWDDPKATPGVIAGSRKPVSNWRPRLHAHTPDADGEPYLSRPDGTREPVGDAVVTHPAAPVGLVHDGRYPDDHIGFFVFTRASGQLIKRIALPADTGFSSLAIDDTGQWLTVVDGASIVLYALSP